MKGSNFVHFQVQKLKAPIRMGVRRYEGCIRSTGEDSDRQRGRVGGRGLRFFLGPAVLVEEAVDVYRADGCSCGRRVWVEAAGETWWGWWASCRA
jgi:hypothetical protein